MTRTPIVFSLLLFMAACGPALEQADRAAPVGDISVRLGEFMTIESVGAGQGVEWRDRKLYLIGDRDQGVIREYELSEDGSPDFTGREVILTLGGVDEISHPTGLTFHQELGTFLGDTVSGKGSIYWIDWARLWEQSSLDGAVLNRVEDDRAVNGTRPEFVELGGRPLIATADYGEESNAVRLYDPQRLAEATRTSEEGVLVAQFPCGPWVQSLSWIEERGWLVLVQNQIEGLRWRLTLVDLGASVERRESVVVGSVDLNPSDELEGFHLVESDRGYLFSSSRRDNLVEAHFRW